MYSRVNASKRDKWPLEYSVVVVSKQMFCNDFHFRPEFIFATNIRTLRQDFLLIDIRRPHKTLRKPLQRTLDWLLLHIAIHVTHRQSQILLSMFTHSHFAHHHPVLRIIAFFISLSVDNLCLVTKWFYWMIQKWGILLLLCFDFVKMRILACDFNQSWDHRSCKICFRCVNFPGNNAISRIICVELQDLHTPSVILH